MMHNENVEEERLPEDFKPGPTTVVCGQGKATPRHPGNMRLKEILLENVDAYSKARKKSDRSKIVSRIMRKIEKNSPPPYFVSYKKGTGAWHVVTRSKAREKIGGLFRDCLYIKYKSSSKAKSYTRQNRMQEMVEEEKLKSRGDAASPSHANPSCVPEGSDKHPGSDQRAPGDMSACVQKKEDEENQDDLQSYDAAREAATESLLSLRQQTCRSAELNLVDLYTKRRQYDSTRHLLVPCAPDLHSHLIRVKERRAAIERDMLLLGLRQLPLEEQESHLYHHYGAGGPRMALAGSDGRNLAALGLSDSDMPSPYLSSLSPSLPSSVMLSVQSQHRRLMEGIREPMISTRRIQTTNQDSPLPSLPGVSGRMDTTFSASLLPYRSNQNHSPTATVIKKSEMKSAKAEQEAGRSRQAGERPPRQQDAGLKTIAEQLTLHYGGDDRDIICPPITSSSGDY